MKKNLPFILPALVLLGFFLLRGGGDVQPNQAHQLVDNGALLLDVRTPGEFAGDAIPGAVNIPVQELANRLGDLPDKERPIVVYCRSGNRSSTAKGILQKAGFKQVHDLGARTNW